MIFMPPFIMLVRDMTKCKDVFLFSDHICTSVWMPYQKLTFVTSEPPKYWWFTNIYFCLSFLFWPNHSGIFVLKSLGAFSKSKAPQNVFHRFIKKNIRTTTIFWWFRCHECINHVAILGNNLKLHNRGHIMH